MTAQITHQDWRKVLSELGRGVAKPGQPLFAPIIYAMAAQIEAISPTEMAHDGSRLRKNLQEMARVLGADAIYCTVPSLLEAEMLGAKVDHDIWPPQLLKSPGAAALEIADFSDVMDGAERLTCAIDALQQMSATDSKTPYWAVLTGPATLASQILGNEVADIQEEAYEFCGRLLSQIVRLYAENGITAIGVMEQVSLTANHEAWTSALGTVANVARFHKVPVFCSLPLPSEEQVKIPAAAYPVFHSERIRGYGKPHGIVLGNDLAAWVTAFPQDEFTKLVTTREEVPAAFPITTLKEIFEQLTAEWQE